MLLSVFRPRFCPVCWGMSVTTACARVEKVTTSWAEYSGSYFFHPGGWRSHLKVTDQLFQLFPFPFSDNLDLSTGQVSYVAGQSQFFSLSGDKGTEEDALNIAVYYCLKRG